MSDMTCVMRISGARFKVLFQDQYIGMKRSRRQDQGKQRHAAV